MVMLGWLLIEYGNLFDNVEPMKHASLRERIESIYYEGAKEWCEKNGYTDPFFQDGNWWAFPPGGVIPVSIHNSLTHFVAERIWYLTKSWTI